MLFYDEGCGNSHINPDESIWMIHLRQIFKHLDGDAPL